MKTQLCKCNKCDTIMIDMNPTGQSELETDDLDIVGMEFITDKGGGYWACPECLSDNDLVDVFERKELSCNQ